MARALISSPPKNPYLHLKSLSAWGFPTWSCAILLSGCLQSGGGGGEVLNSQGNPTGLSTSHIELQAYDLITATLKVTGKIGVSTSPQLVPIALHNDKFCSGKVIGSGLASDFNSKGIEAKVSSTLGAQIYLKTSTETDCYFVGEFAPQYPSPPAPTLTQTVPPSPSRSSTTPRLFGTASPFTSQIRIYKDENCSSLMGQVTRDEFETNGVLVSVPPESTVQFYAISQEPFGKTSACLRIGAYRHSSSLPNAPQFSSITPLSPTNRSGNPTLFGTSASGTEEIFIYTDSGCTVEVAQGSSTVFATQGFSVPIVENAITKFYAQAKESSGKLSECGFLTQFEHDNISPGAPDFDSASPASPSNATLYPKIRGSVTGDTSSIRLFSNSSCTKPTGAGLKSEFVGVGISTLIKENSSSDIFGQSLDSAGNASPCKHLATYVHDTLRPDPVVFARFTPDSPNNFSTAPKVFGTFDETTVVVNIYSEATCGSLLASGSALDFQDTGLTVSLPKNTESELFGEGVDLAGNRSECSPLAIYSHRETPATPPGFLQTYPASPSRSSNQPLVIGSAASDIVAVELFSDSVCSLSLGSSTRSTYTTSGLRVNLPQNTVSAIFGRTLDIYNNYSACTPLTTYTHSDISPSTPVLASYTPTSPNAISSSPLLVGTFTPNPTAILSIVSVGLYDNGLCLNSIGTGSPADYTGAGIHANVLHNTTTTIYAQSEDEAGNLSSCEPQIAYIYDNLMPGRPQLTALNPTSPSFSEKTVLRGTIGASTDFLPASTVVIYSEETCSTILASGTVAQFTGSGIAVSMPVNTTTNIYGATFNTVGTSSLCSNLVSFKHSNIGPSGLSAGQNSDGSVYLNWLPDQSARAPVQYLVRRSSRIGGPYSTITSPTSSSTFTDMAVSNGSTYYYVVAAMNATGTSLNSAPVAVTVSVGLPAGGAALVATPGHEQATLNWGGFNTNMHYSIERANQSGGPYSTVASEILVTSYIDKNLTNDVTYYYRVLGHNPAGHSQLSNEASVHPLGYPPAPTHLILRLENNSPDCSGSPGVILSWTPSAYASSYTINRSISDTSGSGQQLATTNQTTYVDCSPSTSTQYSNQAINYYNVMANCGSVNSAGSNVAAFANGAPPILKVGAGDQNIKLTWTTNSDLTGTRVEASSSPTGPFLELATGAFPGTYVETGLTNGIGRYYRTILLYSYGIQGWPSGIVGGNPGPNPPGPTNLLLTSGPSGTVNLQWSPSEVFNEFKVYRSLASTGPFSLVGSVKTPAFTDSSPLAGVNYYRVTTTYGSFETSPSNTVSYRSGFPTNLVVTAATSSLAMSWNAVPSALAYEVLRATISGGPYISLGSVPSANFTDSAVADNTGFFYRVIAHFSDGTTGPSSDEANGTTTGSTAPGSPSITNSSSYSLSLKWAKVSGATKYFVYKSTSPTGVYTKIGPLTQPTYSANSLTPQTNYYFKVSYFKTAESDLSMATQGSTYDIPLAPGVEPGLGLVDLTWGSVLGATSYDVLRSTDNNNFSIVASSLTTLLFTDPTVLNNQIYFYRIRANLPMGASDSPSSAAVTPGMTPRPPSGLFVVENSLGTEVDLTWIPVSNATRYRVYTSPTSGGPYTKILQTSTSLNLQLSGLTANTKYYFVVTAMNGTLESTYSSETSVITGSPHLAPVAVASGTQIHLSWSAVPGASTYEVLRAEDLFHFDTLAIGIAGTAFSDASIVQGHTYAYKYRPLDSVGTPMPISSSSNPVATLSQPIAPFSLIGKGTNTNSVLLTWTEAPNSSSTNLYRSSVAGGPYSLIQNIPANTSSFTDSTIALGQPYYYVATTLNLSGVESYRSNEVGLSIQAPPTSLTAVAVSNAIQLSWSSVSGATSYTCYKARNSGGPYSTLASNLPTTGFSDTDIEHGETYYYVVAAKFGSLETPYSSETSAVGDYRINLVSPFELLDQGAASATTPTVFARSQTSIDTNSFDGAVSYRLDLVAENTDANSKSVQLLDGANAVVASLPVPANTLSATRFSLGFTPTPGDQIYRIGLPSTTASAQLRVYSARVMVQQVGATRTELYIPLTSSPSSPVSSDISSPLETSNGTSFSDFTSATLYPRDTTHLSRLLPFNSWELETVSATTGSAVGATALLNSSDAVMVAGSEIEFDSHVPIVTRAQVQDNAAGFGLANENDLFQVGLRCARDCETGSVSIFKSALKVRLTQLRSALIYFRVSLGQANIVIGQKFESSRVQYNASEFTNPLVHFQAVAAGAGSPEVKLLSTGTFDFGTSSAVAIAGSDLIFSSGAKGYKRTPAALSLTTGHRHLPQIDPGSGPANLVDSTMLIQVGR